MDAIDTVTEIGLIADKLRRAGINILSSYSSVFGERNRISERGWSVLNRFLGWGTSEEEMTNAVFAMKSRLREGKMIGEDVVAASRKVAEHTQRKEETRRGVLPQSQ